MKTCVVAGGSRNLGKGIVKGLIKQGHRVVFTSHQYSNIDCVTREIGSDNLVGIKCDHRKLSDVSYLVDRCKDIGDVDILVNNFAISGGYKPFKDVSYDEIENVMLTNFYGNIVTTKAFLETYPNIDIFNVVGAGTDGSVTPNYAMYGSTKCAITQFTRSLHKEGYDNIHLLSPGMMPTALLTEGSPETLHKFFNILCEEPDVVAESMLQLVVDIHTYKKKRQFIRYLSPLDVIYRFITFAQRKKRFI